MVVCPSVHHCALYPLLDRRPLRLLKTDYCEHDFAKCERYKRSKERRIVPMNLLPSGAMLEAATEDRDS